MKKFSEYIYEQNIYNKFTQEFIYEIFERKGSPPKIDEICDFLSNKIIKELNNGNNIIEILSHECPYNIFCNMLIINVFIGNYNKDEANYHIVKENNSGININYNPYDKKFNIITIDLYIKTVYQEKDNYTDLLAHEFEHIYDNISAYNKGNKNTIYRAIKNSGYQSLITIEKDDTDMDILVKNIIYCLSDIEKNAYIAQFKNILNNDSYDIYQSDKQANLIFKNPLYKTFVIVKNNIKYLNENTDKQYVNDFCNSYRKITKNRIETIKKNNIDYEDLIKNINPNISNNEIIKKINNRWNKFEKKLIQHTKLVIKELNERFVSPFTFLKSIKNI